jgi:hypothetical protein
MQTPSHIKYYRLLFVESLQKMASVKKRMAFLVLESRRAQMFFQIVKWLKG